MSIPRQKTREYSPGWPLVVEVRRHKVAYWLLRHLSVREIVEALAKQGEVNPVTNKPWSRLPIHQDCKWWREQWRKEATADIAKLQGAVLAQIREVQRQGWLHSDYSLVLKALGQERELLGLDAPTKIDIEHTIRQIALAEGLDPDEAVREAQRIINASAGRPRRARPGSGEDGAAAEEPPT